MGQKDPRQMTTGEVAKMARKAGIKNADQMNKDQLIQAMNQSPPEPSQPGRGGGKGDTPAPKKSNPSQWKNIPGNQS